jgi:hypothetical protein
MQTNHRWIKHEQIPYIHADKLIPPRMFNRLHVRTQFRFIHSVLCLSDPSDFRLKLKQVYYTTGHVN